MPPFNMIQTLGGMFARLGGQYGDKKDLSREQTCGQ